jgi:hypothetical protein
MSWQTADLLEAFEALPEEEKRLFTAEFLIWSDLSRGCFNCWRSLARFWPKVEDAAQATG